MNWQTGFRHGGLSNTYSYRQYSGHVDKVVPLSLKLYFRLGAVTQKIAFFMKQEKLLSWLTLSIDAGDPGWPLCLT